MDARHRPHRRRRSRGRPGEGPLGELSEDDDPLVEHAPCLIVKVTSPGTESIDRREKMLNYRKMPSLQAYLIVDQNRPRIERHWRDESCE
ncbi:MAG: Uma2 family endonuclease [Rubrobacter sp.]|nr:Uma2 family endonuclease [Rubrobacter sp.]